MLTWGFGMNYTVLVKSQLKVTKYGYERGGLDYGSRIESGTGI